MPDHYAIRPPSGRADLPFATATVFACLAICVLLLVGTANRGFGLTDEAFYVAWIGAPEQYSANITPFGPPLHLLFELLGRSLIALRVAGILLLLVSGALLGRTLGRYYHAIGIVRVPLATLTALGGVAGLSYYALWILTPSYNLLANVGGQVILAGAFAWAGADASHGRRGAFTHTLTGAVLMGVGGCLAFFGKPPLGGIAALCVAMLVARTAYLRGFRAVVPGLIVLVTSCALPIFLVVALTGGPVEFASKLIEGVKVLDFGNSPLSIPYKTFRNVFDNPLLLLALVVFALVLAWSRGGTTTGARPDDRDQLRRAFLVLLGFVAVYALALLAKGVAAGERAWTFNGLPTACLAMVIVAASLLRSPHPALPWRAILPPIVLLIAPFATALGTANRFVHQTGASPYGFIMAAPVAAWVLLDRRTAARIAAAAAVFAVATLGWSAVKPYGLTAPIWAQDTPLRVPFASDTVLVSAETHEFASDLRGVAVLGGLSSTTPIVDLSEGGPGTALLLNAQAPYYPWVLHETRIPGSLADRIWQSLGAEQRRRAWIVGPIRSEFMRTRLAATLAARQACYRRLASVRTIFWDEAKSLDVWVPIGCR